MHLNLICLHIPKNKNITYGNCVKKKRAIKVYALQPAAQLCQFPTANIPLGLYLKVCHANTFAQASPFYQ